MTCHDCKNMTLFENGTVDVTKYYGFNYIRPDSGFEWRTGKCYDCDKTEKWFYNSTVERKY